MHNNNNICRTLAVSTSEKVKYGVAFVERSVSIGERKWDFAESNEEKIEKITMNPYEFENAIYLFERELGEGGKNILDRFD